MITLIFHVGKIPKLNERGGWNKSGVGGNSISRWGKVGGGGGTAVSDPRVKTNGATSIISVL